MPGSVLYFGRKDNDLANRGHEHLKQLGFDVECVWSTFLGEKMPASAFDWQGDYIFCFRSYFILRKELLANARIASLNFHPGPPSYPGSGCLNYALYNGEKEYGVTCHHMTEQVDAGQILATRMFPIFENDNVETLLARTHAQAFDLFREITSNIAAKGKAFLGELAKVNAHLHWSGVVRRIKELDRFQEVTSDISSAELARKIRATHTQAHPLTLKLHGYRFALLDREPVTDCQ